LIERERHLRRREPFQTAVRLLQYMLLEGWLEGAEQLTPFGEHDGALVIDAQHRLTYISGVATNLYRKLGYMGELVGERISNLETDDDAFLLRVLNERKCIEEEVKEQQRIWIKKGIPLLATSPHAPFELRLKTLLPLGGERPRLVGVIMTVHDQTDERLREQELNIKSTMIQEIHHRVKNNLQTIAALLRLQARRVTSPEAEQVLQESINRILSVAVVHEFLSRRDSNVINFRDVSSRIIGQIQQGLLDPDKTIRLELNGPSIYLPPQQTTACALVVNELVQNSIEHGFENKASGTIAINLIDHGDAVSIEVVDDGGGLPVNFDLGHDVSLGLRIVQTLATDDLKGRFELKNSGTGTAAAVVFPKTAIGGGT
jgi:two-component system, sensor histidine kinase PdtaS